MKGRAAISREFGKPFEIEEREVPALEPGAILVRITYAGICGTDLHLMRGELGGTVRAARISGHEMTGYVAALGAGVTTDSLGQPLKEGDRVAYPYFYCCGRCPLCLRGQLAACVNRNKGPVNRWDEFPHFGGAYAEYYYLRPDRFVFKVPEGLTDVMVAPINCALAEVTYGLHQARLQFGETVVIQGAGGLGLNAVAVAREMGAGLIIVIDRIAGRLELSRRFGADETINASETTVEERIEQVRVLTGGLGADLVAELVGSAAVVNEGLQMVRNGGRYLEIGNITAGAATIPMNSVVLPNRSIIGVNTYDPWILPLTLQILQKTRGKYPFDQIASHTFPLDQINEAFVQAEWLDREADPGRVMRAFICP